MEPFVRADKVAEYLSVSPDTVMEWRKTLGLPSHRFGAGKRGGTVLFKLSEVALWANNPRRRSCCN